MGISMHPELPDGNALAETEARRKPVRRDPEKRRLQNLQAQRKYREKMKQRFDRLDQLESIVASVTGTATATIPMPGHPDTPPDSESSGTDTTQQTTPVSDDTATPEDSFISAPVSNLDATMMGMLPWMRPPDWDSLIDLDTDALLSPGGLAGKAHWQSPNATDAFSTGNTNSPSLQSSLQHGEIVCTHSLAVAANPVVNSSIAFREVSIMAAFIENCYAIGVTEQMFHDQNSISPFYRPSAATPKSNDFVTSVQNIFKTLKPDLRPGEEQILIPHQPAIDVLPFPTFRKNILRSIDLLCVNPDEGCWDMLNGLVCWGSAGLSRADRNTASSNLSTGTPWDGRSWEAKPWFIRKYWDLLGGEEGELVIQSEWWRRSRGEDADIWLTSQETMGRC